MSTACPWCDASASTNLAIGIISRDDDDAAIRRASWGCAVLSVIIRRGLLFLASSDTETLRFLGRLLIIGGQRITEDDIRKLEAWASPVVGGLESLVSGVTETIAALRVRDVSACPEAVIAFVSRMWDLRVIGGLGGTAMRIVRMCWEAAKGDPPS